MKDPNFLDSNQFPYEGDYRLSKDQLRLYRRWIKEHYGDASMLFVLVFLHLRNQYNAISLRQGIVSDLTKKLNIIVLLCILLFSVNLLLLLKIYF